MNPDEGRIKLLSIHHGTVLGGAPISLRLQLTELQKRGTIRCTVAAHSAAMRQYFKENGLNTVEWPDPLTFLGKVLIRWSRVDSLAALRRLLREVIAVPGSVARQYRLLKTADVNVVHCNSAVLFTSALAARLASKRVVWHVREGSQFPPPVAFFMQLLAHRLICISAHEASCFRPTHAVQVVHNPVDPKRFDFRNRTKHAARTELSISEEAFVLVSLGGSNPRKGTLEILSALNKLPGHVQLIMAGSWPNETASDPYSRQVLEAAKPFSPERLRLVGNVEDPSVFLAAADILVFTGTTPHFPRPVFEAWMMQRPVVVFEMDGISDQVSEGLDGLVVNRASGDDLAQVILPWLTKPDDLAKLGLNGFDKALHFSNPEKIGEQLEEVVLAAMKHDRNRSY